MLNWRRLFDREVPADPTLWHKWWPFLPVRLITGKWSDVGGQMWRRRQGDRWEYWQDPESVKEWYYRRW